jgi:hypothetical protein
VFGCVASQATLLSNHPRAEGVFARRLRPGGDQGSADEREGGKARQPESHVGTGILLTVYCILHTAYGVINI